MPSCISETCRSTAPSHTGPCSTPTEISHSKSSMHQAQPGKHGAPAADSSPGKARAPASDHAQTLCHQHHIGHPTQGTQQVLVHSNHYRASKPLFEQAAAAAWAHCSQQACHLPSQSQQHKGTEATTSHCVLAGPRPKKTWFERPQQPDHKGQQDTTKG